MYRALPRASPRSRRIETCIRRGNSGADGGVRLPSGASTGAAGYAAECAAERSGNSATEFRAKFRAKFRNQRNATVSANCSADFAGSFAGRGLSNFRQRPFGKDSAARR